MSLRPLSIMLIFSVIVKYTASLPVCIRSLVTNHVCTIVHKQVDYCPSFSVESLPNEQGRHV